MDIAKPPQLNLQYASAKMELVDSIRGLSFNLEVLTQPHLLDLLMYCHEPKTRVQVCQYLKGLTAIESEEVCQMAITELIECGILEFYDTGLAHSAKNIIAHWSVNGWQDALSFHIHTNNLEKTDYNEDPKGLADKQLMQVYLNQETAPSAYKCNIHAKQITLLPITEISQPQQALTQIFTDNVAEKRPESPLNFIEFSWYMYLAFGQTGTKNLPITGEHVKKTMPSGGSRHPTEISVVVLNVENISPGLYHYCVLHHSLELIRSGNFAEIMQKKVITHPNRPRFKYNVGFIFSTLFERSMFRYRESRSYRVMQFDLGHVMQNAATLASAINRNSYRGYSFCDQEVDDFLEIDGIKESAMTFMLLG